jgi:hypothetical protein
VQLERLLPLSRYHWPAWSLANGGWGKAQWAASDGAGARVGPVGRRQRQQGRATSADLQVVLHNMERWFAVVGTTDQYVDRCGSGLKAEVRLGCAVTLPVPPPKADGKVSGRGVGLATAA